MFEIRIHGRAGQGAKTIAQFLAEAGIALGKFVQAFPSYGPARSGAAMNTFIRIDDKPIKIHSNVEEPDAVLVIDPLLIEMEDVSKGLKEDGLLIINSKKSSDDLKQKLGIPARVYCIPASKIAMEFLKKNIPNTVLLGALIKATKIVQLSDVLRIAKEKFSKKLGPELTKANLGAIQRGYEMIP